MGQKGRVSDDETNHVIPQQVPRTWALRRSSSWVKVVLHRYKPPMVPNDIEMKMTIHLIEKRLDFIRELG